MNMNFEIEWLHESYWAGLYLEIIIVFLLAGVAHYTISHFSSKLLSKYRNKNTSAFIIIRAIKRFLNTTVIVLSIAWTVLICIDYFDITIIKESTLIKIQAAIIIAIFAHLLGNTVKDIARALSKINKIKNVSVNVDTIHKISTLCQIVIFAIAILMIMNNFGVSLGGLLAFGGMGGIILGFAAKDMVSNLFGALVITMDRPFDIGDRITLIGLDMEGVIEEVNWRFTKMMSIKCYPVYIPNMFFLTHIVENHTRMTHRRIKEIMKIEFHEDCDLLDFSYQLDQMLKSHPNIDSENKYTLATVLSAGDNMAEILLQAFTDKHSYVEFQSVRQSILMEAAKIMKKYNIHPLIKDAQLLVNKTI